MWQQIQKNKRNSYILIFLLLLTLLIMGAVFGVAFAEYMQSEIETDHSYLINSMINGIYIALFIWIILLFTALIQGKKIILSLNHAYYLPKHSHKILENVVEEMSIAAGLPKIPEIYVIDTPMPNAFATGLSPDKSAIAVTTGLLTELNRDELQGVIAHEIAHIVNRDTMYMIFAGVMLGAIVLLAETQFRIYGSSSRRSSCKRSGGGNGVIILICLILAIIVPFVAKIIYFSISQRREYLADACAVQFTRYPQGLAQALAKISTSVYVYRDADQITSAMYIVHPLDCEKEYKNTYSMFERLFSTHPPTEKRIAVLTKMIGADFNAYNDAFFKVSGKRRTILTKEELRNVKPLKIREKTNKEVTSNGLLIGTAIAGSCIQTESMDTIKERKREAENIIWKANNYIFKQCECGTKFKIPEEYKGQEIECPHCKNKIKAE